ncbi:hypothetical protein AVEN_123933-1 [Araneus ventricosus]|uniref:Uncharacterized protein n=1 Tax=Araneus ventricosus TaxID=182803 RepID=A0A4Y2T858_ARAVE|nr:hypothetical protein AVEN_39166-1 [Araneus ventricosus]GBN96803.1 hypothetical protein AVEN_123933-1 [Araneus ventricosus]
MEALYKRHNRPLPPSRANVPTPPPRTLSRERFTPPPPFCGFRFCERGSLSLTHDRISVLWPIATNENPNISTTPRQFSLDCGVDEGFWNNGLQMVWNGSIVKVQLN